jgi:multidrug resistance efflux pump
MRKRVAIFAGIGAVVLIIALGVGGYFYWMSISSVDTLHARVAGSLVEVSFASGGRVTDVSVEVGDTVMADERVATLEVSGLDSRGGVARVLAAVRAPITGVVVAQAAEAGDLLSPGQPIVTLVDPDRVWVEANIHETRASEVQVGQSARVYVRALRHTFPGRVERVVRATTIALAGRSSGADISTPTLVEVPVRISIVTEGYALYPGMTAEVRIQSGRRLW